MDQRSAVRPWRHAAERISAQAEAHADGHLQFEGCQTRGGLKGGLPVCEENESIAIESGIFAELEGNTMLKNDVGAKLKHFSAQVAIEAQSPVALSQGLAVWGQQSDMSSMADVSAADMSADLTPRRAPAAAGSIATDTAIRSARMVRPMLMDQDSRTA
jgi:hypothetical protein